MTSTNMYGEPWKPPPPVVVNAVRHLIDESGILDYLPADTDLQGALVWMAERAQNAPDEDHFDFEGFHRTLGTHKVFRIGFEFQDERENSYHITYIRPFP